MSRRQGVTWAATSVPEVRRQWCNAVDQTVDRFSEGLAPAAPGTAGAGNRRLELPEWTPALVTPSPSGLLCWAKPAGTDPYGPKPASTTDVPWDAVWWWTRTECCSGAVEPVHQATRTDRPLRG